MMRTRSPEQSPGSGWSRATLLALLSAALCGTAAPVTAQVNIEQLRREDADRGFSGSAGLDLAFRTGNVEIVKFDMSGRLDYAVDDFRTFVTAGGDFGWEGGNTFSSEAIAHFRQVFRGEGRVKPELFQQVNYDKLRALQFRGLLGGGVRFTLARWNGTRIWFGTAYMFEREHLDLPAGSIHPARTSYHRWSNYLSSRLRLSDNAGVVWTLYAQPRFDDFGDVRVLADTRLVTGVAGPAALMVSFLVRWDSRPPDEIEGLDTALRTGIRLSF
jgi:hypothetical protein